jgi:hypothetical protein
MVRSRSDTEFSDRAQQITKTFGRQAPNYYVLRTEREAYQVTEEHPLWVQGKGWTPVKNIERGDAIATKDGDTLVRANTKVEEPLRVYNFSVANTPSYFVGTEGIWAHNAGKNCDILGNSEKITTKFEPKIIRQMEKRGWDKDSINSTISNPYRTVKTKDTRWKPDGTRRDELATAYIREDGHYVVRNDRDGSIVQISNRNKVDWISPFE